MAMPRTFKKLFAVAGGATAAVLAVSYVSHLFQIKFNYWAV